MVDKKPRQKRGIDKVELIVKAAIEEFLVSGIHATSTNAIAKRAQIPVGSIYQFFEDKYAILNHLVEKYKATMTEIFVTTKQDLDEAQRLRYLIHESLKLKWNEKYCTIIFNEAIMREELIDFLLPLLGWPREKSEHILRIVLALFTIEGTSEALSGEAFINSLITIIGALLAEG